MSIRQSSPSRRLEILEVPIFTLFLLTKTKLRVPLHGSLINRPEDYASQHRSCLILDRISDVILAP